MTDVLRAQNLTKQYGTGAQAVVALDGVDLTVEPGCLVAVMGASGSGKSTLLHLLGGLDVPTAGRVLIEGHDLSAMSDRERTLFRRRNIGVVFQSFNLLDTLTAAENAALPLMIGGEPRGSIDEKTRRILDAVDMSHRRSHRPQALSGGEQQRVAIARALINDPAIILADEPTGNLDSKHSEEIWQLLAGLTAEKDRTVIAVTHEPAGAAHADRIIVLRDGRMVGELPLETKGDASLVATSYAKLAG